MESASVLEWARDVPASGDQIVVLDSVQGWERGHPEWVGLIVESDTDPEQVRARQASDCVLEWA